MRASSSLQFLVYLFTLMVCTAGAAQEPPVRDRSIVTSGTLNLILANKNGFVIAADSRRSNPVTAFDCGGTLQHYCDDSQKLFRTSDKSAIVISGFASGGSTGTPLDLVVASTLRRRFGPCGHRVMEQSTKDGKMTARCASEIGGGFVGVNADGFWIKQALEPALTGVASLSDLASPTQSPSRFEVLLAGVNEDGKVVFRRQTFDGSWIASGLETSPIPRYQVQDSPTFTIQRFYYATAGIPCVADAILGGYYKSSDPVITGYYSKLGNRTELDSMSLAEMTDLARVILRETAKFTEYVGGPDQIAIIPVQGQSQWIASNLPVEQKASPRFWFNECLKFTKNQPTARGTCARDTFFEDFQHPQDEVIAQFFLGSQFEGVSVALDDNYFVRSRFDGVTFKYHGKIFYTFGNTYTNCRVEFPDDIQLPSDSEVFTHCEKVKKKTVSLDNDTVGKPLQFQKNGTQLVLPLPNR